MQKDYSNKNLQHVSFRGKYLPNSNFSGSDLRGADFTGADISHSNFSGIKTGIPFLKVVLIFTIALLISLLSGFVAMLAGKTIEQMLASGDKNVETAGTLSTVIIILFILVALWRGVGKAIYSIFFPAIILAIIVFIIAYVSGLGTGRGMLFLILSILLVSLMFIIGTAARAAAGSLSNILFIIVAISGGLFSKTVGGGVGTAVMAVSCAIISKRGLAGTKGFQGLEKIGFYITSKFGTSFRNSILTNTVFEGAILHNTDFSGAKTTGVLWGDAEKLHNIPSDD